MHQRDASDAQIHHANPGELRWYAMVEGEEMELASGEPFEHGRQMITPKSRTFVPAKVQDNPYLMATDYLTVLQGLPEPLRSQLLEGDFQAAAEADPWQCIPTEWVQAAQSRWLQRERPETPLTALGVDELDPVARYSGLPTLPRTSLVHALNVKATARAVEKVRAGIVL